MQRGSGALHEDHVLIVCSPFVVVVVVVVALAMFRKLAATTTTTTTTTKTTFIIRSIVQSLWKLAKAKKLPAINTNYSYIYAVIYTCIYIHMYVVTYTHMYALCCPLSNGKDREKQRRLLALYKSQRSIFVCTTNL